MSADDDITKNGQMSPHDVWEQRCGTMLRIPNEMRAKPRSFARLQGAAAFVLVDVDDDDPTLDECADSLDAWIADGCRHRR